jgi:hypothetical protein
MTICFSDIYRVDPEGDIKNLLRETQRSAELYISLFKKVMHLN